MRDQSVELAVKDMMASQTDKLGYAGHRGRGTSLDSDVTTQAADFSWLTVRADANTNANASADGGLVAEAVLKGVSEGINLAHAAAIVAAATSPNLRHSNLDLNVAKGLEAI